MAQDRVLVGTVDPRPLLFSAVARLATALFFPHFFFTITYVSCAHCARARWMKGFVLMAVGCTDRGHGVARTPLGTRQRQ
eukprot:7201672-Pyramimonas_sp.AAC.1